MHESVGPNFRPAYHRTPMGLLHARLDAGETLVLDGGLATSLEAAGLPLPGPLWSARALLEAPDLVRDAHAAFAGAGAEVLLTASYQLSRRGLQAAGLDPSLAPTLFARAVALAREAGRDAHPRPLVAGSLGPYGAALADSSEYTGRYDIGRGALRDFHAPRVEGLVDAGADLLAVETVPGGEEVQVIADLLADAGRHAWVSVTVAGDGTRTPVGEPLLEALGPAAAVDEIVAVGVNCVPDELVVPALEHLAPLGVPLVAKPNAGARWDPVGQVWRPVRTPVDPRPWLSAGARLVGGCCGTAPADVAALATAVGRPRAGHDGEADGPGPG